MQFTVTRPRLRNLYFRINALLSLDILPEALDSSVPDLKKATVAARPSGAEARQQRRQFTGGLGDCQRLLTSLGVPCVTGLGEAEASTESASVTGAGPRAASRGRPGPW